MSEPDITGLQRAKIKHCNPTDENFIYFHLYVSGRLRKNQIKSLKDNDGNTLMSHNTKAHTLHRFFSDFLGVPCSASTHLHLMSHVSSISPDSFQTASLAAPFSLSELRIDVQ